MTLYTQTNHLKSEIERLALATSRRIKIHYYSKPEEITGLISIEEAETTHADSPKPVVWAIRGGERERFPPESFYDDGFLAWIIHAPRKTHDTASIKG